MNQVNYGQLLARVVTAVGATTVLSSALALKVDMYAIGNWSGGNCAPGVTDNDRGAWPGMAQAWYDKMGAMGHSRTGQFVDGNTTAQRFCDPAISGSCKDFVYIDWPDAAIVAAHGYGGQDGWAALMRNSFGTCNTKMGGSNANMFVGDSNLKFLHASSCQSLNDNYFSGMRAAMKKAGSAANKGLHVMTGFHGDMWITSGFNGNYAQTSVDGHFGSVANAWVANHYKSNQFACAAYDPLNLYGTCKDQCPTAMTVGASGGEALGRLFNERYNNSTAWGAPSGNSYYAWMGYVGCEPQAKAAFNP
jgi:hypothetical protein